MVRRPFVPLAVLGVILWPTLIGRGTTQPIEQLALQRTDVPATITAGRTSPEVADPSHLLAFGVRGLEAARYLYSWPAGGTLTTPIGKIDKEWQIEGEVFRAPDERGAKRLYALGVAARIGLFSYEAFPGTPKNFELPAYGDEQIGVLATDPATGLGVMVFVRKGRVLWQLRVATTPLQYQVTQQQLVEVLNTYARKQMSRAGGG